MDNSYYKLNEKDNCISLKKFKYNYLNILLLIGLIVSVTSLCILIGTYSENNASPKKVVNIIDEIMQNFVDIIKYALNRVNELCVNSISNIRPHTAANKIEVIANNYDDDIHFIKSSQHDVDHTLDLRHRHDAKQLANNQMRKLLFARKKRNLVQTQTGQDNCLLAQEKWRMQKLVNLENEYKRCKVTVPAEHQTTCQEKYLDFLKLAYEISSSCSKISPIVEGNSVQQTFPNMKSSDLQNRTLIVQDADNKSFVNAKSFGNTTNIQPLRSVAVYPGLEPVRYDDTTDDICKNCPSSNSSEIHSKRLKIENDMQTKIDPTFVNPLPRIHEELSGTTAQMSVNKFLNYKSKMSVFPNIKYGSSNRLQNPVENFDKKDEFIGASGPFLSLCEQLTKNNPQTNVPLKSSTSDNIAPSGGFNVVPMQQFQNTQHQFTNRGPQNTPVTGESMKASAQVVINPNFGNMNQPICFMPSQTFQNMNRGNSAWQQPTNLMPFNIGNTNGYLFMPNQNANIKQAITGFGGNMNTQQMTNLPNHPYFCSFMPSGFNIPGYFVNNNAMNLRSADNMVGVDNQEMVGNPQLESDIIYATFTNQSTTSSHSCEDGLFSCATSKQCISKDKWCDSMIDCLDSSDEITCSCKSRLAASRICDGYQDCPMGSDELGCFGCDKFSFSCYLTNEEYILNNRRSISMCYTLPEKCDGFVNCLNGRDEEECSMIVRNLKHHLSYMVSHSEGFLHRNYKGKWHPVCYNSVNWAKDACEQEVGHLNVDPKTIYKATRIEGPFLSANLDDIRDSQSPHFTDTCVSRNGRQVASYVSCPTLKCGTTLQKNFTNHILQSTQHPESDIVKVVGGLDSDPLAWPYIVAIYRNGIFTCAGAIYSESWIVTAAHCLQNSLSNFYEVRAGMLRRRSFSPMVQIIRVVETVVHPSYNHITMQNDIGMMKLEHMLSYNRWVRPLCTSNSYHERLKMGEFCTIVGWGALQESGIDPDNLQETRVPIVECKYIVDRMGNCICAGEPQGGRDGCQGDSGGPLICKSHSDSTSHYLAGVVSHGEGCARPDEPGAYTQVALFTQWLSDVQHGTILGVPTVQNCPGKTCVWGGGFCISHDQICDRIVDCLGGEDEVNCQFDVVYVGATKTDHNKDDILKSRFKGNNSD